MRHFLRASTLVLVASLGAACSENGPIQAISGQDVGVSDVGQDLGSGPRPDQGVDPGGDAGFLADGGIADHGAVDLGPTDQGFDPDLGPVDLGGEFVATATVA